MELLKMFLAVITHLKFSKIMLSAFMKSRRNQKPIEAARTKSQGSDTHLRITALAAVVPCIIVF
jgi:hypothetical protein